MLEFSDLIDAYYLTRKNKRRSNDSIAFEMHWERNLVNLYSEICGRKLKSTAYTFVTDYPKPREVFACDMKMRIIHHYIDMRIRPYMEQAMTTNSYNNRIGYGNWKAINAVIGKIISVTKGYKNNNVWIIKLDLQGFFPNAVQEYAYKCLIDIIPDDYPYNDEDELIYMIHESIFSDPTKKCFVKSHISKWDNIEEGKSLFDKDYGIGGAIGHLIWQNAMNLYLNKFDHWIVDELKIEYVRFVDDMVFITDNKEYVLSVIPKIREKLAEIGCKLSERKFYCQHYTKGLEFLGTRIKPYRMHLNDRTIRTAYKKLRKFNKCPKLCYLHNITASFNSFLGMCKNRSDHKEALKFINK